MGQRNKPIKLVAAIVGCVLLDIILHVATSSYSTMPESPNYSILATWLGTEPTVTLWALLAFCSAAGVFCRFQNSIPGSGLRKGLRYGSAIALLWLFAMLEGVPLFGHAVINEFVVGLSDALPVLVMGVLLGGLIVKNGQPAKVFWFTLNQKLLAVGVFSLVFVCGRYAAYFTGVMQSGLQTSPFNTFMWTLLMGACIGMIFILLGPAAQTSSLKRSAALFGCCIFGVNWAVFLLFMPMLFSGFWADVLIRIAIDIGLVTSAYYLTFGFIINRSQEAGNTNFYGGMQTEVHSIFFKGGI